MGKTIAYVYDSENEVMCSERKSFGDLGPEGADRFVGHDPQCLELRPITAKALLGALRAKRAHVPRLTHRAQVCQASCRVLRRRSSVSIVSLGIDPGLRSTGVAVIEKFGDGNFRSRGVKILRTEPLKGLKHTRASVDDVRRMRILWTGITAAIAAARPNIVAVENYLLFEPKDTKALREGTAEMIGFVQGQMATDAPEFKTRIATLSHLVERGTKSAIGLGQSAKTIAVYGVVLGAAFTANVPVLVYEPGDRTRRIGGRRGASKDEVGSAVLRRIAGLAEHISEKVPQHTLHEHVTDAAALAWMGADDFVQMGFAFHAQGG